MEAVGKKKVIVLIPMGIPGIGKTTVFNIVMANKELQSKYVLDSVSNDDIKKDLMDKYIIEHPKATKKEAFDATTESQKKLFFNKVKACLEKKVPSQILILDKNHPRNAVQPTVANIKKSLPKDTELILIGVVQETTGEVVIEDKHYPFSPSTILRCIQRVRNRPIHSTLTNENKDEATNIILFFVKLYENFSFAKAIDQGLNDIIQLPYCKECPSIPTEMIDELKLLISGVNMNNSSTNKMSMEKFNYLMLLNEKSLFVDDNNPAECAQYLSDMLLGKKEFIGMKSNYVSSKKIPLYLALSFPNQANQILGGTYSSTCQLMEFYKSKGFELKELESLVFAITNNEYTLESKWKIPYEHHVTAFYLGNNKDLVKSKFYEDFKENIVDIIVMECLVIIPEGIVFCTCSPSIAINNKIPHMTILTCRLKPNMSNEIGEKLFLEVPELKDLYLSGKFKDRSFEYCREFPIDIQGSKVKAYVININKEIKLSGVTKRIYN